MKVSEKEHARIEKTETPRYEAKEHSASFLKKAERLAERTPKGRSKGGKR